MTVDPTRPAGDLRPISELLPRHAEEGPVRQTISEAALAAALAESGGLSEAEAVLTIRVLGRLFDAAALLDRRQLALGNWAFVSFPAYLLARSISELLANSSTYVLPADYWEQGAHRPKQFAEEQRRLLEFLERGRVTNSNSDIRPIRYVHVGWGIVRLEGRFLLHHREDRPRAEAKTFVFPGGRLNQADLPESRRGPDALPALQSAQSKLALGALPATLKRELLEELRLTESDDYSAKPWSLLKPYRKVEGTLNNLAYTEYVIQLFHITLTAAGEAHLLDCVTAEPERFAWFSPDELAEQCLPDGTTAFVDAIAADWGSKTAANLRGIPDSSTIGYRFREETQALDVPLHANQSFLFGKTGKERELDLALDEAGVQVVLAHSWHAKGLPISNPAKGVVPLPNGWLKIADRALRAKVSNVAASLSRAGYPFLECYGDHYSRMAVSPEMLFVRSEAYRFSLRPCGEGNTEWMFELSSGDIETPLGKLKGCEASWPVPRNIQRAIQIIESGGDPIGNPQVKGEDLSRDLRERLNTRTRQYGLRRAIRIDGGRYQLLLARRDWRAWED